jgi:hypothetical protein
MANPDWGMISSAATFDALAGAIIGFEDQGAAVFCRPGPDGGQDARSSDSTLVFQFKFHKDESAAKAIADAKKEGGKLLNYRRPGHARYVQWQGVTHWRLVTNAIFNTTDREKWDNEVAPLFRDQGLSADYWDKGKLNELLTQNPGVHRYFFGGEPRAFLTLQELSEILLEQEPFLRREKLGRFCGRNDELQKIRDFLATEEKRFLVIHGAGGIGKTRLLVEAGESIAADGFWQVLWANIASMTAGGAWFEGIVPERPTLLLVDNPPDDALLQQIAEQIRGRGGRAAQWKVAVTVRSPNAPVLKFLLGPRMKTTVQELVVSELPESDAEDMCADLLTFVSEDKRVQISRELAKRFSCHPIWLTLAIQLLEERGELTQVPTAAEDLADEYLYEIENKQNESPPGKVRDLLRWVALIGTVNIEDDATIKLIGEKIGVEGNVEIKKMLVALVKRRALIKRGAHDRLMEIRPDVIRDHILLKWLSVKIDSGANPIVPSDDARRLIENILEAINNGSLNNLGRSTLVSLFRTEFDLKLSGLAVQLSDDFFRTLKDAVPAMTASQRLTLIGVLEIIAIFQPIAVTRLIRLMKERETPDEQIETIFGTKKTIGQTDVLLALAWPLFSAAIGAQTPEDCDIVLQELCSLVEAEADWAFSTKRGLPNDGKRAAVLIARIVEGGPQFWVDFNENAYKLGNELIEELAKTAPAPGKVALLKALVQPALAVERTHTWSDEQKIYSRTVVISNNCRAWEIRDLLLKKIKETLSTDATPLQSREELWHVFVEAHRSINRARKTDEKKYFDELYSDLTWAYEVLERRKADIKELTAARDLWDWHFQFEENALLKEASDKLEALYASDSLASEFEPLLRWNRWEQREQHFIKKAAKLASQSAGEIEEFLNRAITFLGNENELNKLTNIAWQLGSYAPGHENIQKFVKASLAQSTVTSRTDFGAFTAAQWVISIRKSNKPECTHECVNELLKCCGSDDQRVNLLLRTYGRIPEPPDVRNRTSDEHALLRAQKTLFIQKKMGTAFIRAVAVTLDHEWHELKSLLEEVLQSLQPDEQVSALNALIDSVYWAVRDAEPMRLPADLNVWILNQLLRIPDFDNLDSSIVWHLDEILKFTGRAPINWLPKALQIRQSLEYESRQNRNNTVRAIGYHMKLGKCVKSIVDSDVGDASVSTTLESLIDFSNDRGSIGHYLPEILGDVDPDGIIIPRIVSDRIRRLPVIEDIRLLARLGRAYPVGSQSWRIIAKSALSIDGIRDPDIQQSIYTALAESGVRSWSRNHGEVPTVLVSAVQADKDFVASETDNDFRPFWEWRLKCAEDRLREAEERAKEERGE